MTLERYILGDKQVEAPPSTFFAARNALLGNEVAVRRLAIDPERAADVRATFFREQRLMASLGHPRVQRPLDVFEADGYLWSVHDQRELTRTSDRLAQRGALGLEDATRLGSQVADALSHLHERGLVFGRMAPISVMVDGRGDALLVNFVKAADLEAGLWPLRGPVQALGPWTAPEEWAGERPTTAADVYGVAATVVTWLLGEPPFGTGPRDELLDRIRAGLEPSALMAKREDVPEVLAVRLARALAFDPQARPRNMAALGSVLSEIHQRVRAEIPAGFEEGARLEPEGTLGRVEVRGRIGSGAFGVVLRVRQLGTHTDYAMKVLKPEHRDDSQVKERFLREARALAPIQHNHVVRIRGVGQREGVPFVVMDLIDGPDLAKRIMQMGGLQPAEVARVGAGIAKGLSAIHEAGLVHRDIKPHNVLLDRARGPVIADFGMATYTSGSKLTMTGQTLGTPAYMAPEQLEDGPSRPSIDLWALGVILHEALSGEVPFVGAGTIEVIRAIRQKPPLPLPNNVPAPLAAVVHRLLEKDPANRFPSAASVVGALEAVDATATA